MRKSLALATTAAVMFGLAITAVPASAETTNVTFTLTGGGLSLTVPSNAAVTLNSGALAIGSTSVSSALNATTVTDMRGQLLGSWKVQVTGSDYVTGASTTSDASDDFTIPKASGTMYIGVANAAALLAGATGGLVPTSVATQGTPASLATAETAPTLVSGTTAGSGSLSYTPTLSVAIPAQAIAGTYSGSVVQTAS